MIASKRIATMLIVAAMGLGSQGCVGWYDGYYAYGDYYPYYSYSYYPPSRSHWSYRHGDGRCHSAPRWSGWGTRSGRDPRWGRSGGSRSWSGGGGGRHWSRR